MTKDDRDKKLNYLVTDYSRDFWNKTPEEYRPYLRKINEVLMKIKKAFGAEQDVEFVVKLDRNEQDIATGIKDIYLVQTRDIKMWGCKTLSRKKAWINKPFCYLHLSFVDQFKSSQCR